MAKVRKVRKGKVATGKKPRANTLPTVPNEVPKNLLDFCWMIFGRKAIGKTTLASLLSKSAKTKALVLMLEKTRRNLRIYQLPKKGEKYPDWLKVLQYAEDFVNSDVFDVLVIDTLDKLYELCFEYVCKQFNVSSPAKAGRDGSGIWVEIAAEFNALLQVLADSGKGIIFISHEKLRELEAKRMRQFKEQIKEDEDAEDIKIERIEPSASPAALRAAEEMCDFVLYYGYQDRKRVITVRDKGDYFWVACGVADRFLDPDGNEINSFYVGETPLEAKQNLIKAFNNELRDIDYEPPRRTKKKVRRKVRA